MKKLLDYETLEISLGISFAHSIISFVGKFFELEFCTGNNFIH